MLKVLLSSVCLLTILEQSNPDTWFEVTFLMLIETTRSTKETVHRTAFLECSCAICQKPKNLSFLAINLKHKQNY